MTDGKNMTHEKYKKYETKLLICETKHLTVKQNEMKQRCKYVHTVCTYVGTYVHTYVLYLCTYICMYVHTYST